MLRYRLQMTHNKLNEYIALRYSDPLTRTPGEAMTYTDFNYVLLGEIIRRVSGKSLDNFARERLFVPLGMKDSYYETPDFIRDRMVDRPVFSPSEEFQSPMWKSIMARRFKTLDFYIRLPVGSDGVISTAMDMAIFGQMFLNRGVYGDIRLLSPASVTQMTQNQIPGTHWIYGEESGREACWGYGWGVHSGGNYLDAPVLCSAGTFWHGGSGFVYLWIDPVYEIVGCFFSVSLSVERRYKEARLFADMVTAAVEDI